MTDETSPGLGAPRAGAGPSLGAYVPRRSTGLKLILVCALALMMAIPALFVYGVVYERSRGAEQAVSDVSRLVGGAQTALGPVLAVPYARAPNPEKPDALVYGVAVAYAETGAVTAEVAVEERERGIHLVPVFEADLRFSARFDPAALRQAVPADADPIWADAGIYMGVSDTRGVKEAFALTFGGRSIAIEPAGQAHAPEGGGYRIAPNAGVALAGGRLPDLEAAEGPIEATATMRISGAQRLAFGPFAKETTASLASNWDDPSFTGGFLPDAHTAGDPDASGFTAEWRVPYLARGIPGATAGGDIYDVTNWDHRDMAVRFIREANPYQSVQRALKYGAMFIGFVFLAYFLFEVTSGARAHPAQYVLVGLAQTIFYLLLLAFSEVLSFDLAFAIAAGMTITLIAAYAGAVFRSAGYGLRALLVLSGIYGLIYILMRAEGQALLAGALASFAAIALTMWMTRNVDWYGEAKSA